jgi:hypothetical protein
MPIRACHATTIALPVLALLAAACGSSDGTPPPPPTPGALGGGSQSVVLLNQGDASEGHTPRGFRGAGTGLFVGDNLNSQFPDGDGVQLYVWFDLRELPAGEYSRRCCARCTPT